MAQVSGSVTKVWADNTDFVKKAMCWSRSTRPTPNRRLKSTDGAGLQRSPDPPADDQQQAASGQYRRAENGPAQAQSDLNRRVPLGTANLIGREELQHARDAVASAQAQLDVAIQQYNANQAMVLGTSLENQPAVKQAATEVRNAWLALQRTKIVSPMTGYVSRRSVQPGRRLAPPRR